MSPTTRAAAAAQQQHMLDLPPELLRHIMTQLELRHFFGAGRACKTLRAMTHDECLLASLPLEPREPPAFTPSRENLLRRLADAGNGAACYRLGLAYAYHPRPASERAWPLEESAAMLRRAMDIAGARPDEALVAGSIAADAAYELWLLTRRVPAAGSSSEELLAFAAASGHSPAKFAAHRSRSSTRRPGDFVTSEEFSTAQCFLIEAFDDAPLDTARFSVCSNPACGRWGVRAREVRRRSDQGFPALQAPPGLPRCQGMHGMHCRTRYCSRYCQALHWPEHRKECSQPEPLLMPPPPLPPPQNAPEP